MKRLIVWALLAGMALAQPKLAEVDQASQDPALLAFRGKLLKSVHAHDVAGLRAALDPKIRYSFGIEKPGPDGFLAAWKAKRADSTLWKELEEVLVHGGSFTKEGDFVAPWIYANWPEKYDSLEYVAVLTPKVPIYAKADPKSQQLAQVGHTMLKRLHSDDNPRSGWVQVELPQEVQNARGVEGGYVRSQLVRGGLDFRAIFEKRKGKWMLTTFIGGD